MCMCVYACVCVHACICACVRVCSGSFFLFKVGSELHCLRGFKLSYWVDQTAKLVCFRCAFVWVSSPSHPSIFTGATKVEKASAMWNVLGGALPALHTGHSKLH